MTEKTWTSSLHSAAFYLKGNDYSIGERKGLLSVAESLEEDHHPGRLEKIHDMFLTC